MKRFYSSRNLPAMALIWTMLLMSAAVFGQTRVVAPKNKYKVQDDVKIGQEASQEVQKQFPILDDAAATRYVQEVGDRLVRAIPPQFQQPAFDYQFRIVNASDINAFALPGGPMYVNRGMIEAAKNEGEMAGVMAHEISHIALRHATANQTKLNNPLNQILGIGAVLGGAVLGGQTGAQLGQVFAAGYFLRYSREYEAQADTLGAQIMARAGYDPRDLANMFRTIQQQSGGGGNPEWLSDHPDPGKRYESITREAQLLKIEPSEATQDSRAFHNIQERLSRLPAAPTMAQIEQNAQSGRNTETTNRPVNNGQYNERVAYPSTRTQSYSNGNWLRLSYPANWQPVEEQSGVWFAPDGAYGQSGITRGALIGIVQSRTRDLGVDTKNYVSGLLQNNSYLRQRTDFARAYIGVNNSPGYVTVLEGVSPITRQNEMTTVYTTQLSSGDLFYIVTVAPSNESGSYDNAFRRIIGSIRLNR